MTVNTSKTKYRADIDGLRAIAVLLVVIYHAGFEFLSGGYVGVDVFFVISGYLITGIVYKEIKADQFQFRNFYKRRILRLMPALIFTLVLTSFFALIILLPNDLLSYGYSLLSVIFSVSNVYFWRANGGYFEGNTQEVPLLHTWSLSVEEQFYIVWPIVLIIMMKWMSEKWMLGLMLAGLLGSIFISEYVSHITFGAAYYLLPTRAFELMFGAILALSLSHIGSINKLVSELCSLVGLALIAYAALVLTEASTFPGYNAVIPTLGATLLIFGGLESGNRVSQLLSFSWIVKIGLISYSVYLVHWPLIVFVRYLGLELTNAVSLTLVVMSLALGWVSWKYVETPFRHSNKVEFLPTFKRLYVLPGVITSLFVVSVVMTSGYGFRFKENIQVMEMAVASQPAKLRSGCHSASRNSDTLPNETCSLGDSNSEHTALLIGDSHSNHYSGFFDEIGKSSGIRIMDYTLDECIPVFGLNWGHNAHYANKCRKRNDVIEQYIQQNKFGYVILAGHWPSQYAVTYVYDDDGKMMDADVFEETLIQQLNYTITQILASGAQPILVKDMAPSGHSSPKCAIKRELFNGDLECDIPLDLVRQRDTTIDSILSNVTSKHPQLIVMDPKEIVCDETLCVSTLDNIPLFLDRNHLNDMGSRVLGRRYLEMSGSPF